MAPTRFKGDYLLSKSHTHIQNTATALREKIQKELKNSITNAAKKACMVNGGYKCPLCHNTSKKYLHVCHEGELAKNIIHRVLHKHGYTSPFHVLLEEVRRIHKESYYQVACSDCNIKLECVGHTVTCWFDDYGWSKGRIVRYDPVMNEQFPYLIKYYDYFEEWVSNPESDKSIIYHMDEFDYDAGATA